MSKRGTFEPKGTPQDGRMLCTGFAIIRSTPLTIKVFSKRFLDKHYNCAHDQLYVNALRPYLNHRYLNSDDFPNGEYFYTHNKECKPALIHFNWVVGHRKKAKMKSFGKWYVGVSK